MHSKIELVLCRLAGCKTKKTTNWQICVNYEGRILLRNPFHEGDESCKRGIQSGFENQKVHNRSITNPKERTDVLQNSKNKQLEFYCNF